MFNLQLWNLVAGQSYQCTYRTENFGLTAHLQMKLCLFKITKSDVCIRLFCKFSHIVWCNNQLCVMQYLWMRLWKIEHQLAIVSLHSSIVIVKAAYVLYACMYSVLSYLSVIKSRGLIYTHGLKIYAGWYNRMNE